jgi:hypothetical protein
MNAFINSDGVLQCYGYVDSNAPGDTKISVPADFSLTPGKWRRVGESWLPSVPPAFPLGLRRMRNWIRNSQWRYTPGSQSFTTTNGAGLFFLDPVVRRWWHGPGVGAETSGSFQQAIQGDWEGNPEQFLRIEWTKPPTMGDPSYVPIFRNTILEHWINTARVLAGKFVTLSWQMRSPGGAPVALIIWRSIPGQAMERWSGETINLPGDNLVYRYDFSMKLPAIPIGTNITPQSYVGVGVDIIGAAGPTIDFGPCQFNEGGPQPIAETQYESEKLMASLPYP